MLFVTMGALEHCTHNKGKLQVICPSIWIHYVIGGKGYFNGLSIGAGQAFIVYKNDFCEYYPDESDPWTYIWIRLEGDDSEELLRRCKIPLTTGCFDFDYAERLADISKALFGNKTAHISNRIMGEATAKMILSLNFNQSDDEPHSCDAGWVIKAKSYISSNYHRRLKVEQIAEALHIDRQYLRNLFVKHEGISTKEYLDAYRMSRAAELLRLEDSSVYIVALSVGYSDSLAFSKAFKKHYGMSPSKYARHQRS
ncbi:MAG: helix-turn-helix domain-containing protein [Clostridia bacterium]|nr:helix-turn-helix domain-containing protein [Clostridia bacterium]